MSTTPDDLIRQARAFDYVREVPENRGLRVEAIQHWSAGQFGDSWCAEFVWFVLDIVTKGRAPLPRTGSAEVMRAATSGWAVSDPQPGDLFFYVNAEGRAHHVGIVTGTNPLMGIAWNTSEAGSSVNGDGVHEHEIHASVFARLPLL